MTTVCTTQQRDQEIISFLPLVKQLVGRMAINLPVILDTEDLVEAGIVGLIAAIDNYQPNKGTSLKTYVYTRVTGAILDELRKVSCFSREFHHKLKKLQTTYANLQQILQRPPSLEELSESLSISIEELAKLLTAMRSQIVVSLDKNLSSDSEEAFTPLSMLATPKAEFPDSLAEKKEITIKLADAIEELPEKERQVIVLYYYKNLLLQEISTVLGVSPARISHLHSQALYRLNHKLWQIYHG